jgi:hypothetical protein
MKNEVTMGHIGWSPDYQSEKPKLNIALIPKELSQRPDPSVTAKISKHELLRVLFDITLRNQNFNADEWALADANDLIRAGEMIRREIEAKRT